MTTWVALLRGINVGGIAIRNSELMELFSGLDLRSVRALLSSGNVRFEADGGEAARDALKTRIEEALRTRFGYDAWLILVTSDELAASVEQFPFDARDSRRQPWVVFCVDASTRDELVASAQAADASADPVAPGPGVVYWNPLKGTSTTTAFAKVLARAAYKSRTTNRNLRTLRRLID